MEGLREKIRTILTKLDIQGAPVPVEKVAELFSIPVLHYPLFPKGVSGTIINQEDLSVIGVNSNMADVRKRFTIAHELGHYLLGHDHNKMIDETFDNKDHKEQEANKFAAELLMPFDFLSRDVKVAGVAVPGLAKKYLVSEQAMSVRLLETSLIHEIK
jgi:Zn-dependent peptidase ImmA (M78 family)